LSSAPSSGPSSQPSTSTGPSTSPSGSPSLSVQPSSSPSTKPSLSSAPSSGPSSQPSTSTGPSTSPSGSPSLTAQQGSPSQSCGSDYFCSSPPTNNEPDTSDYVFICSNSSNTQSTECVSPAVAQAFLSNSTAVCGECPTFGCDITRFGCLEEDSNGVITRSDKKIAICHWLGGSGEQAENCISVNAFDTHTENHCDYCGDQCYSQSPPCASDSST
jgi:hypothetical protein